MNYGKIIKKNFNFLKEHGFKRKVCSENMDDIIEYSNMKNAVIIWRALAEIKRDNCEMADQKKGDHYKIIVMIAYGRNRNEIFKCDLFSNDKLTNLKNDIMNCNSEEEQLKEYAEFLNRNISNLL